jgi:hypothetical protein
MNRLGRDLFILPSPFVRHTMTSSGASSRNTPWRSLFKRDTVKTAVTTHYPKEIFGKVTGGIDIRCYFDAKEAKWTRVGEGNPPEPMVGEGGVSEGDPMIGSTTEDSIRADDVTEDQGTKGLFYFKLEFAQRGSIPLRTGSIHIRAVQPEDKEPVPVFTAHAPSLMLGRPFDLQVRDTRARDPHVAANGPGAGAEASGLMHETETNAQERHQYSFKAGIVPNAGSDTRRTNASFVWSRTSEQDFVGLDRTYVGALIVFCENNAPLSFVVRPGAKAWHKRHRLIPRSWTEQTSKTAIWPRESDLIEPSEFDAAQTGLEEDVGQRNENGKTSHT